MRSNIKGGSKASDLVMSTNPVLCGDESPVLLGKQFDFDPEQLSLYNTTGGARKSIRKKIKSNKQKGGDSCNKKYGEYGNQQHGGDNCNKKYEYANHQHGGKKQSRKKNKKSKSSRRKSNKRSNSNSNKRSKRRNKRGGSKSSNSVLKGSPCNATNLVGGSTKNAFIRNSCRG